MNLATALLPAGALSGLALLAGWLTRGGALAATLVGAVTYGLGGAAPAALLVLFFVSSSALSRWGGKRKRVVVAGFQKSGARDHGQVLANGGLAAVLAAIYGQTGNPVWLAGVAGALASANADTWSTELGVLSPGKPRMITTGAQVEPGSSGAVSALGTLAALAGAALIGATGAGISDAPRLLPAATIGGFAGALLDSLLGATVQAIYRCSNCGRLTESHPRHNCGGETSLQRGWGWLQNDQVNFAAGCAGALLSYALWSAIG